MSRRDETQGEEADEEAGETQSLRRAETSALKMEEGAMSQGMGAASRLESMPR